MSLGLFLKIHFMFKKEFLDHQCLSIFFLCLRFSVSLMDRFQDLIIYEPQDNIFLSRFKNKSLMKLKTAHWE